MSERPIARANESGAQGSTSRSLLLRLRSDEKEAWERFVRLYGPLVQHWCTRAGVREGDDVAQEVFQAVARHIGGFRREGAGQTFRGWLHAITRSKVADHHRKQAKEPQAAGGSEIQMRFAQIPSPEPQDPSDAAVHDGVLLRALEQIRGHFQEQTWTAFWRIVVDGLSAPDVARELGMSPGAVRVAKSRVLQRLREELGELIE